jgi:hexosaminidase
MHEMQSWFIKQIDNFLVENNRRLIGWDEIAEGGLAKNAAVMWWRGAPGVKIAKKAAQEGHDIVVASNPYLYFDYYQGKDTKKEPLAIGGYLPLGKVYNFDPIIKGLSKKEASHILGAQGQLWTEYIPNMKHVEYMAYPRACALAELTWLPKEKKNYQDFFKRLKIHLKRLKALGVNYRNTY